jgi:hypothetical protein
MKTKNKEKFKNQAFIKQYTKKRDKNQGNNRPQWSRPFFCCEKFHPAGQVELPLARFSSV